MSHTTDEHRYYPLEVLSIVSSCTVVLSPITYFILREFGHQTPDSLIYIWIVLAASLGVMNSLKNIARLLVNIIKQIQDFLRRHL